MNTEDRYQEAKKRVKEMKDFYVHLGAYVLVNAMLFLINMITSPDTLWFFWPLFGWGLGVAMHAVYVFGFGRLFGPDWEERKIQEILDKGQV
jgi:hypothetical protein